MFGFGKQVNVKDLYAILANNPTTISVVDVRSPAEYKSGSVPQAINIPLNEIPSRATELRNFEKVYVICQSGGRSQLAIAQLQIAGLTNTYNVSGGTSAWITAGYPVKK